MPCKTCRKHIKPYRKEFLNLNAQLKKTKPENQWSKNLVFEVKKIY